MLTKAKTTQLEPIPQTPEKKKRNISTQRVEQVPGVKSKLNTSSKR